MLSRYWIMRTIGIGVVALLTADAGVFDQSLVSSCGVFHDGLDTSPIRPVPRGGLNELHIVNSNTQ